MAILTLVLGLLAGICIATGLIFLFTSLRRLGRNWVELFFSLFAFSYAGANLTSIMEYKSTTLEGFMRIEDWTALFTVLTLIFLMWFVSAYTKTQPRIFMIVLTLVLGVVVSVAILNPKSIHNEIFGIVSTTLPWGETITQLDASESIWELIFFFCQLTIIGFLIFASVKQFRRGEVQDAIMLGIGLLFLVLALTFDMIFIDSGVLNFIYLGDYGFIPLLIVMAIQLSNDVIRTEEELASYRHNLEQMVNDQTQELRTASVMLERTERRVRALLDAPPDSAMLLTVDGNVLATNRFSASRLGLTVEDAIGKDVFDLFNPEIAAVRKNYQKEVVRLKQPKHWEDQRAGRFYDNHMYPILDEHEEVESVAVFAADITERKQAELALQESEAKYRYLVEKINEVIYALDSEGVVTYVSPAIEAMIGYSSKDVIGQHFSHFIPADTSGLVQGAIQSAMAGQSSTPTEYRIRTKSSGRRWVRISSQSIERAGQLVGVQGVITDISELKKTEGELQKNVSGLNRLIQIIENISLQPDITIALQQASEQIVDLFQARYMHIIYTSAKELELYIMSGFDAKIGPIEPNPIEYRLDQLPLTQQVIRQKEALISNDLDSLMVESKVRTFLTASQVTSIMLAPLMIKGNVIGVVTISRDKTKHMFDQLDLSLLEAITNYIAAAIENARLVYANIESAATEERNRLAHDLHDAVTQTIYSASLIAEVLPQVWDRNPDEGKRNLIKLRALVRGALAEMRTMLFELRPSALESAGIESLLGQLGDALHGRTRIQVQVECEDIPDLPAPVKVAIYRIAQEAVNNIIKHASATQTCIELKKQSGGILLRVWDDGFGFNPQNTLRGGLGLQIMQERADRIGGYLEIDSHAGQGTEVSVLWQDATQNESGA